MKIVIMGDLHYPEIEKGIPDLEKARADFYQTFLGRFLDIEADMHVSLGDLTNYGLTSELRDVYEFLAQKEKNFYHVLGNHDLYAQPRQEVLAFTKQSRYHAIISDNAVFAFLDTAKEMDQKDWGGWIDDEQLQWFENVVIDSGTKPLFVFAHHPVYNTTKRSDMDKGSIHPSIDMWKILEQKQGIGVYFNGHTHIDSIEALHNWTFVQTSACLDQPALRILEIRDEEILISAVDITDKEVVENASIIYNNIEHFAPQFNVRGTETDRQCRISLQSVVNPYSS